MVQERVQENAKHEGLWKLPGGLADPGEDLGVTACREVLEETGIRSEFSGVVSLRHAHNMRFGQADIYFVLRLRAVSEEIKIDPEEIRDARWMALPEIEERLQKDEKASLAGCISQTTFKAIREALQGNLIQGSTVRSTAGADVMMYSAL